MADLRSEFIGIKSPNPFWLASAPPTDKEYNVRRAYEAGWGGVVWKTLGMEGPPVVNVNGPRYGAIYGADRRLLGLNNIELITDRPLEVNLEEMRRVKRDWPDRALIASLMVPVNEDAWREILHRVEDTGCDGVELNFGCPHGMSERGMGSAVGQVPEYVGQVAHWCKKHSNLPVIVKLSPNVASIEAVALAAAGAAVRGQQVQHRYRPRAEKGSLVDRWEIACTPAGWPPHQRPIRIKHDHVTRQVLIFTSQAIGDPGSHRRMSHQGPAAVHLVKGRGMHNAVGMQ